MNLVVILLEKVQKKGLMQYETLQLNDVYSKGMETIPLHKSALGRFKKKYMIMEIFLRKKYLNLSQHSMGRKQLFLEGIILLQQKSFLVFPILLWFTLMHIQILFLLKKDIMDLSSMMPLLITKKAFLLEHENQRLKSWAP